MRKTKKETRILEKKNNDYLRPIRTKHLRMEKHLFKLLILMCLLSACNKEKEINRAKVIYEKGVKCEEANQVDSAAIYYRTAINLLKGTNEYELLGEYYNQLGNILSRNNNFIRARYIHQQALKSSENLKDKTLASKSLRGISRDFLIDGKPDSALIYLIKASKLTNKIKNAEEISRIHNNLSTTYCELGMLEKALYHNGIAIKLAKDSLNIYKNFAARGKLLLEKNQFDSASYYCLLGSKSEEIYTKATCYYLLAQINAQTQNSDSSKYTKKYQVLLNEINERNKSEALSQVEYTHELNQSQYASKLKLIGWISLIIIIVLPIVIFLIRRLRDKHNKLKNYRLVIKNHRDRIKILQDSLKEVQEICGGVEEQKIKKENLEKEIEKINDSIIKVINNSANASVKSFAATKVYQNAKQFFIDNKDKPEKEKAKLAPAERDKFLNTLSVSFRVFINLLEEEISLGKDESVSCCLSKLKFDLDECCILTNRTSSSLRTEKSRIKGKFKLCFNNDKLFELIFISLK